MRRLIACSALLIAALVYAKPAGALTIDLKPVKKGDMIPNTGVTAGAGPGSPVGSGNLDAIVAAAASQWKLAIQDDFTLTVYYGWGPLDGTDLAGTGVGAEAGTPKRISEAGIVFRNTGIPWWIDGTPNASSSEYFRVATPTKDLGGGQIGTGFVYYAPGPDIEAAKDAYDLFTVAMHELGHALGLATKYSAFTTETEDDDDIDVTDPRPKAGTTIDMDGSHIKKIGTGKQPLMYSDYSLGERRLISTVDCLAVAQVSSFTNTTCMAVPEPSTFWLTAAGMAPLLRLFRKRG